MSRGERVKEMVGAAWGGVPAPTRAARDTGVGRLVRRGRASQEPSDAARLPDTVPAREAAHARGAAYLRGLLVRTIPTITLTDRSAAPTYPANPRTGMPKITGGILE